MMTANLESLKQSLRQIAPTALVSANTRESLPTGLSALDTALESGGLAIGSVTEIAGAPSSGKTAIALTLCATHTQASQSQSQSQSQNQSRRDLCAYIDGRNEFYPPAAAALDVDLNRLLWVRPGSNITEVARATEILIRSRAFALLVVDLPRGSRLMRAVAQRLRTSASQTSTSIVVLCERANDVEQAHTRIQVCRRAKVTSLLIHKGSAGGGSQTVSLPFERRHFAPTHASPISPVANRVSPGNEPPGAVIPTPSAFPMPLQGAI